MKLAKNKIVDEQRDCSSSVMYIVRSGLHEDESGKAEMKMNVYAYTPPTSRGESSDPVWNLDFKGQVTVRLGVMTEIRFSSFRFVL